MESPNEDGITFSEREFRWSAIISHFNRLSEDVQKIELYRAKVSNLVKKHQKHFHEETNLVFRLQDGLMEIAIMDHSGPGAVDYAHLRHTMKRVNKICHNRTVKNIHFLERFNQADALAMKENAEWDEKQPSRRFPEVHDVSEEHLQSTLKEWEEAHQRTIEMKKTLKTFAKESKEIEKKMNRDAQRCLMKMMPFVIALPASASVNI